MVNDSQICYDICIVIIKQYTARTGGCYEQQS